MPRALVVVIALCSCGPVSSIKECRESSAAPDGATVTGRIVDIAGQPIANKQLLIERNKVFDLFGGVLAGWERTVTTDAAGSFSFSAKADELRNGLQEALTFSTTLSHDGVTASYSLRPRSTRVTAPDLQVWRSTLSLGADRTLTWQDLAQSSLAVKRVVVHLGDAETASWRAYLAPGTTTFAIPDEVLEDAANLPATIEQRSEACDDGTVFSLRHRGESLSLPAGTRVPVSRDAPCTADVSNANTTCLLTNGQPSSSAVLSTFSSRPQQVTLDLGSMKSIRRVVLKNLSPYGSNITDDDGNRPDHQLQLEASTDGTTFTRVLGPFHLNDASTPGCIETDGRVTECWLNLELTVAATARFVRVQMMQNLPPDMNGQNIATIAALAQISLWE